MKELIQVNASFIPLTQNQIAIVDTEDYNWLNQYKWYANYLRDIDGYYAVRSERLPVRRQVYMHRLIIDAPKGKVVDHINHNSLDNRRSNLRIVSRRQNSQNKKGNSSSKYPGVSWNKREKKWYATILIGNKRIHLGIFKEEIDAAKAYEKACRELIGEELVCKAKKNE